MKSTRRSQTPVLMSIDDQKLSLATSSALTVHSLDAIILQLRIFQPQMLYDFISAFLQEQAIANPVFICLFHTSTVDSPSPVLFALTTESLPNADASYLWTSLDNRYYTGIRRELIFQYQLFAAVAQYDFILFSSTMAAVIATLPACPPLNTIGELHAWLEQQTLDYSTLIAHLAKYLP